MSGRRAAVPQLADARPRAAAVSWLTAALAALACALAAAAPRAAHACYVCMSGREDETGRAFFLGSVLLSLLPFALFGGIALFVWWRVRASQRAEADAPGAPRDADPAHEGAGGRL